MTRGVKHCLGWGGGVLVCLLFFGVASSFAQDLGEAARQERLRRQKQLRRATRVYTEDDLAKPQILDPQDRARFEAARDGAPAPVLEETAVAPAPQSRLPAVSLADLARELRAQREASHQPEVASAPRQHKPVRVLPSGSRALPVVRAVRVEKGDSLWKLAKRHLGRGAEWRQLAAANPQLSNPDVIHIGQWISLPPAALAFSVKQVRVSAGDSLWKMARAELGRGAAWPCIAQANPQLEDASLIFPGEMVRIPADCTATP